MFSIKLNPNSWSLYFGLKKTTENDAFYYFKRKVVLCWYCRLKFSHFSHYKTQFQTYSGPVCDQGVYWSEFRAQSSGIWHIIMLIGTNVLDELAARSWKQQVATKCWYLPNIVHGITFQKTVIWNLKWCPMITVLYDAMPCNVVDHY